MKFLMVISFSLVATICFGQQKLSNIDSTALIAVVKKYRDYVVSRDDRSLKEISLSKIYCAACISQSEPPETAAVPVEEFIKFSFNPLYSARLVKCIASASPMLGFRHLKGDFEDKQLDGLKELNIYEVFYVTTKPNEVQEGHEGQSTALQFVKINGQFKLFGFVTVP